MDVSTALVAHPQPAELVQPTQGSLHHPTVRPPTRCRVPHPAEPGTARCGAVAIPGDAAASHRPGRRTAAGAGDGVGLVDPAPAAPRPPEPAPYWIRGQQLGYVVAIGPSLFPRRPRPALTRQRSSALSTQARDQSRRSEPCNLDNMRPHRRDRPLAVWCGNFLRLSYATSLWIYLHRRRKTRSLPRAFPQQSVAATHFPYVGERSSLRQVVYVSPQRCASN